MTEVSRHSRSAACVAALGLLLHGCGSSATPIETGSIFGHEWRYELVDGLPRWVVDGDVAGQTLREPQFSPAHPHLSVANFVGDRDGTFVQIDVNASAEVDRAVLVVGGIVEDEVHLVSGDGAARQHGAAVADPRTWSAILACGDGEVVDVGYAWLPDGLPEWEAPDGTCRVAR